MTPLSESAPATVFVIILNWNRELDTAEAIDSFLLQREVTVKVLLVDNGSDDGSGDRLHSRYAHVDYLQIGSNLGYTGGNNRGIQRALAAGAQWVLVVNNDTVAHPDCLRLLVNALQLDSRLGAVSPYVTQFDAGDKPWFAAGQLSLMRMTGLHVAGPTSGPPTPCTFLSGCCLLFRAEVLRQVGLFREDLWAYAEDVDLSLRMLRAGWRLAVVPEARLAHKASDTRSEPSPRQIVLRDRNRRRIARASLSLPRRLLFSVWFFTTRAVHLVRYLARGDMRRFRAILDGLRLP